MNQAIRQNRLSIGILGCGPISQAAHLEACWRAKNVELYAICDKAEDLLERMSKKYPVNAVYQDYYQMLDDPNVDAVIIGVADDFHVPCALDALRAGKHVLVEKPLGTNIDDCRRLSECARASGLVVQVGNMKRFDPGIQYAKEFIETGMGEMLAFKSWYCDSTYRYQVTDNVQPKIVTSADAKKPAENPKANKEKYYMLTHGSHLLDTARFLGGPLKTVNAQMVRKFDAYSWQIAVEFENGTIGNLDLTVAVRMDWHEGFHIYGEFGSVLAKTYNPWLLKSSDVEVFTTKDGCYHRPLGPDGHFYRLQVEGFAESILSKVPQTGASVEDGLETVRAIEAIRKSLATGERVALDGIDA